MTGRLARTVADIHLSLGPNNASYFVTDGKDHLWRNLPAGLNAAIESLRKPGGGEFTSAPRLVALGVQGNYMMITDGHGGSWSVPAYPELDTFLDEQKVKHRSMPGMFSNVATLSLDAFDARNFVMTYFDGGHYGYIPDELDDVVWPVLHTLPKSAPGQAPARLQMVPQNKSSTLGNVLKLANVVMNASGAGGGVDFSGGGGGVDFSGMTDVFTSTLQGQAWSSVGDAAVNWNVQ